MIVTGKNLIGRRIKMLREEMCNRIHEIAKGEIGVHEVEGAEANPRIVEYASHTTLKATSDEIPWCSAFANYCVDTAGSKGSGSAAARSWLDWGIVLEKPILGCVVVFERKDANNPNAAHVAICDHPDISNGIIRVIGGNQSDGVTVARSPVDKVLGYRSPRVL
jgi:uncharacterized protein (TIGR02594 family)